MATIKQCDACGVSTKDSFCNIKEHHLPYHIVKPSIVGYTDNDGNRVSGKMESLDLCVKCSNSCMAAFYDKFKELKEE